MDWHGRFNGLLSIASILAEFGPAPEQIVISLSDRAVPFGESAPDVVQFFESYRIENDICVWEMF